MEQSPQEKKPGQKITLPVKGMTCASCVARVERVLQKTPGIVNISVNLATEKVAFEITRTDVTLISVAKAIEQAGYHLVLPSEATPRSVAPELDPFSEESRSLLRDLRIAIFFAIPVFIISMGMEWKFFQTVWPFSSTVTHFILLMLTLPIVLFSGQRFYRIFWKNLRHRTADMNSLVAIGTGAAFIYSTLVTLFPSWMLKTGNMPHVYFDSTATIIALILMGRWLEHRAKNKTGFAIKKLLEFSPKTARVRRDNQEFDISLDELAIGDIVLVKPGQKIASDGVILSGVAAINEAMLSGESLPVEKSVGDVVYGGTINLNGALEIELTALGEQSLLGKIIKLVEEAQGSKAPIQRLADQIAAVFVPVVVGIAFLTLIGWLIFGGLSHFENALLNFVAVLIIACPCALGLATPTAIMVGTGLGASHGILIKNGATLELLHKVDTIILDKTGTITTGLPQVVDVMSDRMSADEIIRLAASLEQSSEHPLGRAVVAYAAGRGLELTRCENFSSSSGAGVQGSVQGQSVMIGNTRYLSENGVGLAEWEKRAAALAQQGKSILYIALERQIVGLVAVADQIKSQSKEAIEQLKAMRLRIIMLSGDHENATRFIAEQAGVDDFYGQVTPVQKAAIIKEYQDKGHIVAMVGDGINDAPALAQADVGIAIGSGTDIAIESSPVTLIHGDLQHLVKARQLSARTIKTIKQNLFWAFFYNVLGIPLAVAGFLNPMFAALAMSFSSVSVVSNSLRLRRTKI